MIFTLLKIFGCISNAVASAQKQLGVKSRIVSAYVGIENGYLTYTVCAIDSDMKIQSLITDPGNGKVLIERSCHGTI